MAVGVIRIRTEREQRFHCFDQLRTWPRARDREAEQRRPVASRRLQIGHRGRGARIDSRSFFAIAWATANNAG